MGKVVGNGIPGSPAATESRYAVITSIAATVGDDVAPFDGREAQMLGWITRAAVVTVAHTAGVEQGRAITYAEAVLIVCAVANTAGIEDGGASTHAEAVPVVRAVANTAGIVDGGATTHAKAVPVVRAVAHTAGVEHSGTTAVTPAVPFVCSTANTARIDHVVTITNTRAVLVCVVSTTHATVVSDLRAATHPGAVNSGATKTSTGTILVTIGAGALVTVVHNVSVAVAILNRRGTGHETFEIRGSA